MAQDCLPRTAAADKKDPKTALVALGVDPWKSLARHPTTLLIQGLVHLHWRVEWVCLHQRNAAAAEAFCGSDVTIFGPGRVGTKVAWWHHRLYKAASIGGLILKGVPPHTARQRLLHLSIDSEVAHRVTRSWERSSRGAEVAFLFGDNPLTRSLLRCRRLPPSVAYTETGDFRLRRPDFIPLLVERGANVVPNDPADHPDGVAVADSVLFPVPSRFAPAPRGAKSGTYTIGFVGRIHEYKGLRELIAAAELLRRSGMALEVLIVGDGELAPWLLDKLRGCSPWLHVLPGVKDEQELRRIYASLDCYVVSSSREANEGVPVSALEALVCGVPVVAADVGGIRNAIGDLVTIVSGVDPETLSQAIRSVLESDRSLSRRSRIPDEVSYATALLQAVGR
jgi:glycosyltransferase involved in cell wall biosynthesis